MTASEISATGRNFVTKGKIISSDVETGRNKPKQEDLPITRRGLAGLIVLYKIIKKLETPMQNVELEKTDFFNLIKYSICYKISAEKLLCFSELIKRRKENCS